MTETVRKRVALPETRQLDLLAQMLEARDVDVARCPLVAIKDSPDRPAVVAWLKRFAAGEHDLFVIYTGEGLKRLLSVAEGEGLKDSFLAALERTPLLTRGPKPARVLRELGIKPQYPAVAPTTAGVIETLAGMDVDGKQVAIQLYGDEPLPELTESLAQRGARVDCVAPYVYASESDDAAVEALIGELAAGKIDAIAFTSKAQVQRLASVAANSGTAEILEKALASVVVAAVGPVAAAELDELGIAVDVVPEDSYFMKPMVTALIRRLDG